MCGEREVASTSDPKTTIRNGAIQDPAETGTIPDDETELAERTANGYLVFGMHEPYDYYQACKTRKRNYNLFVADRVGNGLNNQGDTAVRTRQNNNGERHGFECPEERDYYPYWHPSPWKDIAILIDEMHKDVVCEIVKKESQNVQSKNYCTKSDGTYSNANNEADCSSTGGTWNSQPSWGISAPDCITAPYNLDNHLGNGVTGFANTYNWTLPTHSEESCISSDTCACVLRIRYNISSDFVGWGQDSIDYRQNGANSPVNEDPIVPIVMDAPSDQVNNDGADYPTNSDYINMKLAIDTTQFGRTFQDRSHVFGIRPRPSGVPQDARIFNLNVRGKRGNIVQAYPATEYDFVPEALHIYINDYIHFQWTGCDKNPAGNAGEGTDQTDRHNMVQIENIDKSYPVTEAWYNDHTPLFESKELRFRFAYIDQPLSSCNPDSDDEQATDNCKKLNAAPTPYFDGGLLQMNKTGEFSYMSTRNNNFTNRSQKGSIVVNNILSTAFVVVVAVGGAIFLSAAAVGVVALYSRSHPTSSIAQSYDRLRNRI